MKKRIRKVRIAERLQADTYNIYYILEFCFYNEKIFNGYSLDSFSKREYAQNAMNKHITGERIYEPFQAFGHDGKSWLCKPKN